MRSSLSQLPRARGSLVILLALVLVATSAVTLTGRSMAPPLQGSPALESSIFTFDGKDFVRSKTTLMTEAGKPAVNTKLEHESAAYKALMQKQSYTGDVTVFGKHYSGSYAPLVKDGKLTGALFVGSAH